MGVKKGGKATRESGKAVANGCTKLEWEKVRAEKAACKQAQREQEAIRRQSIKQLQNEARLAKQKPPNNGKKTAKINLPTGSGFGTVGCDKVVPVIL